MLPRRALVFDLDGVIFDSNFRDAKVDLSAKAAPL